jgi:hypothetical protein
MSNTSPVLAHWSAGVINLSDEIAIGLPLTNPLCKSLWHVV